MNIIITGPLGHIGSKLIEEIHSVKNLKKIYLIDNASSNNLNVLFNLKTKKKKFIFINEDLKNQDLLNNINSKIHLVIHLASITNAEQSFKNKEEVINNNLTVFNNVLKYCLKKKVKLMHISSTSVYGIQKNIVSESTSALRPQSPYADVKLKEEIILQKNKNKLKFVTFRFGTITGTSKGMRFHTAVNKFCFNTIIKKEIPVWNDALDQFRPYLSLDDAIKTIIFFINRNLFNGEIYNVLTRNYTVRNILDLIKKNGYKMKIKKTNSPVLNQNSYLVSKKKNRKLTIEV